MAENAEQCVYSGQEVQQSDINQLGATGGLADDHVLAELLRLAPMNGSTVAKAIMPYSSGGSSNGTVTTTHGANASLVINPFRAVVGSRNLPSGSLPTGSISTDSPALANWRDIRSGVYVGSSSSLTATIALAPSGGTYARWDLVYASIAPDASGPSVNRRVKNPTTGALSVSSVPNYINSPVTVSVAKGTEAAGTPALPALPGDGSGVYNIPLAYVRVPHTFTSTSAISTKDIRATAGSVSSFVHAAGGIKVETCSGNNDGNSVFNGSAAFAWAADSWGTRPGPWLPPDMTGGLVRIAQIDNFNASNANWSHQNGGVVDSSRDWRNRYIKVTGSYGGIAFASDPTATISALPFGNTNSEVPIVSLGNSIFADNTYTPGGSSYATVWAYTIVALGATFALVVDMNTGYLLWYTSTPSTISKRFFFWIEASGQFPNE